MRRECQERFPRHRLQRQPLVSGPGMHHGTCVMHVPWYMSRSLTRGGEKTFPAHAQPAILRNWQEAHSDLPHLTLEQPHDYPTPSEATLKDMARYATSFHWKITIVKQSTILSCAYFMRYIGFEQCWCRPCSPIAQYKHAAWYIYIYIYILYI